MAELIHLGSQENLINDDIIRLGGKTKKKWATITEQLARQKKIKFLPLKVLTSPITTVGLVGILATLKGVPIGKTLKVGLPALIGIGVARETPALVEFIKRKARPVRAGEFIGGKIEELRTGLEAEAEKKPLKERIKEGLKKAGLIGGALAVATAGAVAVKKGLPFIKTKLEERKAKKLAEAQFIQPVGLGVTEPIPVGIGGIPVSMPLRPVEPITAIKQVPPIQNIIQLQIKVH